MPDDSTGPPDPLSTRHRSFPQRSGVRASEEPAPLSGSTAYTRRRLLKAGGVVALLAGVSYALVQSEDEEATDPEKARLGVPADSFLVADVALDRLFASDAFRSSLDQEFDSRADGPSDTGAMLEGIETQSGIDPAGVDEAVAFARFPETADDPAGAAIFESPVDPGTVRANLDESNLLVATDTYGDVEILDIRDDEGWELSLGALEGESYAVGARREVEAVVDVRNGTHPPIGGTVLEAQDRAGDGFASIGFVLPERLIATLPELARQVLGGAEIESGHGTLETDPTGQLSLTVRTASESHADDLASQLRLLELLDSETVQEEIGLPLWMRYRVVGILQELAVESNGAEVAVTIEDGFGLATLALAALLRER